VRIAGGSLLLILVVGVVLLLASTSGGLPAESQTFASAIARTEMSRTVRISEHLLLTGPTGTRSMDAGERLDLASGAGEATMAVGGLQLIAVVRGEDVWLGIDRGGYQVPLAGRRYLRTSLTALTAVGAAQPVQGSIGIVNVLRGAYDIARSGGRYRFRVNLEAAVDRTPASERAGLQRSFAVGDQGAGLTTGQATLRGGSITSMTLKRTYPAEHLTEAVEILLRGVNDPVSIQTPPATDTATVSLARLRSILASFATGGPAIA
jgi:hypothetical protein